MITIEIIETIEITGMKIVNVLEIIVQGMTIGVEIDITIKEVKTSNADHQMMIEGANNIEEKKEIIESQEIRMRKNTDYYEIYIIILYLVL